MTHYLYHELEVLGVKYTKNNHIDLKLSIEFVDPDNSDNYTNWKIDDKWGMIKHSDGMKCSCGHYIEDEFRIVHKKTKETLSIGSVCIDKFLPHLKKEKNKIYNKVKNPDRKFCTVCDKMIRKETVEKYASGVITKYHYHTKCYKEKFADELAIKKATERAVYEKERELEKIHYKYMNARNTTLNFGKYKNKTLDYVYDNDLNYFTWLSKNSYSDFIKDRCSIIFEYLQ